MCGTYIYAFVYELCSVLLSYIVSATCSELFPCPGAAITTIHQTCIKIRAITRTTAFIKQGLSRNCYITES
jgi:hypothetical protein